MEKITCPKCGATQEYPMSDLANAKLDYWVDERSIFHWECFECNYQWQGDFKGKEMEKKKEEKNEV